MDEKYLSNQISYLSQLIRDKSDKEGGNNPRTGNCQWYLNGYYNARVCQEGIPYTTLTKTLSKIYVEMLKDYCYQDDFSDIDKILDQVELIEDYLFTYLLYLSLD